MNCQNSTQRLAIALAVLSCFIAFGGEPESSLRSDKISLEKYAGLWFELARTPNKNQDNRPEKDGKEFSICYETTATYTPRDDGYIDLRNVCYRYAADGTRFEDAIGGAVKVKDPITNRKLGVAFGSGFAQFFQRLISGGGFDYWIYRVGPETSDGKYSWAIVSNDDRSYLFILTRTASVSEATKATILAAATEEKLPIERLEFNQVKRN